ncbi:MAG: hypothetical protein QGI13_02605 [Rhodospirillales bacterium]|nr:hypothetical protein [Rhodospirillales bacterium]
MKNRALLTAIVSLFLIAGLVTAFTTLGPADESWRRHLSGVDQALRTGDQGQFEINLEAAVAAAGQSPGQRLRLAAVLDARAADLDQAAMAETLRRHAADLRQDISRQPDGTDPTELLDHLLLLYADGLFRVAGHYLRRGMASEAEGLLKRVLFVRESILGPGHGDVERAARAYAEALAQLNGTAGAKATP